MPRRGQVEAELGALFGEEAVGDLGQYAAAVAERRVRADGAAATAGDALVVVCPSQVERSSHMTP